MNYLLWVLIPNLRDMFEILEVLGCILSIGSVLFYILQKIEDNEEKEYFAKFRKNITAACSVSIGVIFISCFIPSKKDIMQLKAVSIVTELKGVDKIPQKLIDRLNDLLSDKKDTTND